jgi:nicotinate dehydrogenase subunit B
MATRRNFSTWTETGAIAAASQVDDWIAIEPDGTVTVFSGKVELGTGVRTALAQIVAEELDVPIERVRMVMGDTARTPDEGYTAGSKTIELGGYALRQASAEARRALLEMASDRLDAAVDELVVRDGVISVSHHPAQTITYAELMGGKPFHRKITGKAPVKRPEEYRIVGKPVPRLEILGKFTGAPSFVHDIRLPGMLHGRVVRPPSPGATLVALDENSVEDARVVRLGDFVGVVAEREEQAVRAAKQLKIEWRETANLPPMGDPQRPSPGIGVGGDVFDYLRRQPTTDEVVLKRGGVQAAFKRAAVQLRATYYQPYQAHASIGPSCGVADFRDDHVTVWCSTQGVYPLREALADLLQMPEDQVHVVHAEGAGCYGHNGADDVAADAAVLSRAVGKPVRVQWSRQDEFAWEPYAPAMVMEVHGGLDAQGNVTAWEYAVWSPTHAARARAGIDLIAGQLISGQPAPARDFFLGGERNAPTNYVFPHQRVTVHWLARSPLRVSSFRSLGATGNTFANESFMDELAAAARIDPLEFRLRHLSDPRARDVLTAAAQRAGWGAPLPPGEGRGIAFAQYENEEAYVATVAHVRVDAASGEVRVLRIVVAHDCGLIINPDGLRNQIEGNVIQSTSRALKEQVTWEGSRITSVDWDTYPILKFSEVPAVEVGLINRPDQRAVGAGEPASITTAPAIANAIFAATGARVRQVPFTPRRVRAALAGG